MHFGIEYVESTQNNGMAATMQASSQMSQLSDERMTQKKKI